MSATALGRFCRSTLGIKPLMAGTGVVLFGSCMGHLSGNLPILSGQEAMNNYAAWIHNNAGALWTARVVLFASVVAHDDVERAVRCAFFEGGSRIHGSRLPGSASPDSLDLG